MKKGEKSCKSSGTRTTEMTSGRSSFKNTNRISHWRRRQALRRSIRPCHRQQKPRKEMPTILSRVSMRSQPGSQLLTSRQPTSKGPSLLSRLPLRLSLYRRNFKTRLRPLRTLGSIRKRRVKTPTTCRAPSHSETILISASLLASRKKSLKNNNKPSIKHPPILGYPPL